MQRALGRDPKLNVAEMLLPHIHAFAPRQKRPLVTILSDDAHAIRDDFKDTVLGKNGYFVFSGYDLNPIEFDPVTGNEPFKPMPCMYKRVMCVPLCTRVLSSSLPYTRSHATLPSQSQGLVKYCSSHVLHSVDLSLVHKSCHALQSAKSRYVRFEDGGSFGV